MAKIRIGKVFGNDFFLEKKQPAPAMQEGFYPFAVVKENIETKQKSDLTTTPRADLFIRKKQDFVV